MNGSPSLAVAKARSWCFTINNPTGDERHGLRNVARLSSCRYIVCGTETGESGTPHVQGFVVWKSPRTLSAIKRMACFRRSHLERMRGSHRQASDYCKKDGDWWEEGDLPQSGRRVDLNQIRQEIEEGKSEFDIASNYFSQWAIYRRSFERYRTLLRRSTRTTKSWTNLIVGPTGTGKTRFVFQQHAPRDIFVWAGDRWFNGYTGQPVALLDDFRGELSQGFLLRLLDRYPMQVPVKGGFEYWHPRRIYITSNIELEDWWAHLDRKTRDALWRRIDRFDRVDSDIFE